MQAPAGAVDGWTCQACGYPRRAPGTFLRRQHSQGPVDSLAADRLADRSIVTDTGWKILLGRGLDIFQYVTGDAFDLATKLQEYRHVKGFGVTYIREGE
jgi:Phospholipase D-like domain at C-terminus of MIT